MKDDMQHEAASSPLDIDLKDMERSFELEIWEEKELQIPFLLLIISKYREKILNFWLIVSKLVSFINCFVITERVFF
jgi:hypothetical protein